MADELTQRARRIETRVTEIAIALGVGQGAQKPEFIALSPRHGHLLLPSVHASIASILENIPEGISGDVDVFLGEKRLLTLRR